MIAVILSGDDPESGILYEWVGNSRNVLLKNDAGFIKVAPPQFDF